MEHKKLFHYEGCSIAFIVLIDQQKHFSTLHKMETFSAIRCIRPFQFPHNNPKIRFKTSLKLY